MTFVHLRECRRGDLNPHPHRWGLGPQPVSAHGSHMRPGAFRALTCGDRCDLVRLVAPRVPGFRAGWGNVWGNARALDVEVASCGGPGNDP